MGERLDHRAITYFAKNINNSFSFARCPYASHYPIISFMFPGKIINRKTGFKMNQECI
jgi:hypothetical protein